MSVTGSKGIGIPTILFHDAEGAIVTIELKNGSTYRGQLCDTEDNMNCQLTDCTKVDENGKESKLTRTFIRGSQIKFVVVPNILSKAPFFNRIKLWRKFKGHPVYGANTNSASAKGGSSLVKGPGAHMRGNQNQSQNSNSSNSSNSGSGGGGGGGGGGNYYNSGSNSNSSSSSMGKRHDNTPAWMTMANSNPSLGVSSGSLPAPPPPLGGPGGMVPHTGRHDNTPAWMTNSGLAAVAAPQSSSSQNQDQHKSYNPEQYVPGGRR